MTAARRAGRHDPVAFSSGGRCEWVVDEHAGEPPAGLEVLGQQPGGAGAAGGLHDQGVPERQGVPLFQPGGADNERGIDLDELPLGIGVDE
jgi:hypothetical protein